MKFILWFCVFFSLSVKSQTIEVVVSASPGGPNDTVTRKIIDVLEKHTNLQFVVLNKPGAAKTIAYNYVKNSLKPTLIFETPEVEKHDVFVQLEDLFTLGYFYNVLVVSEKSGIKNLNQLMDLSYQREINFGHGGIGSFSHLSSQFMCEKTLRCLDVPYKSSADGMLGLLSGTIDAYAIVSYGSSQFLQNPKYVPIYNIKIGKDKSWYKVFGKNLSEKDSIMIFSKLKSIDSRFFKEIGLE